MQALLAATLLFAALWFVALRPKPSTGGESAATPATPMQPTPAPSSGAAPGTEGLKSAIDQADGAVATANADAQRAERSSADGSPAASSTRAAAPAGATEPSTRSGSTAQPARHRARTGPASLVEAALRQHKAVAIAFVDPRTADARAVAQEIRHVSHFGGRAVTLAVPLTRLSDYGFVTKEVEVTVAPTVVIVDPRRRATTIVGFSDRTEIEQRLADALATKRR